MNKKILVLGDIFLDIYSDYESYRNSPEVKAPVLINKKIQYYVGGAGNLAANLRSFNEMVVLISFFNNDEAGKIINKILIRKKIQTFFINLKNYQSITKERVLNNNKQLARIDSEKKNFHTKHTLKLLDRYLKKI